MLLTVGLAGFGRAVAELGGAAVLDGVDLTLAAGGCTVLMGPNGAGKTLLLKVLHGLLAVDSGENDWNGTGPGQATPWQALVFQTPVLLRRSVAADLDFVLKAWAASGAGWPNCPTMWGWRTRPISRRGACRGATSSGWRWRAHWPPTRRCSCSTSRRPASTRPRCWRSNGPWPRRATPAPHPFRHPRCGTGAAHGR